jgi:hypothetical protein
VGAQVLPGAIGEMLQHLSSTEVIANKKLFTTST